MDETAPVLLDTNVILGILNGKVTIPEDRSYILSEVVVREMEQGAHAVIPDRMHLLDQRLRDIELTLSAFEDYQEFDDDAERSLSQLMARVGPVRTSLIGSNDAKIAAHAHSLGADIMTLNLSDFRPFASDVTVIFGKGAEWITACGAPVDRTNILCTKSAGHLTPHGDWTPNERIHSALGTLPPSLLLSGLATRMVISSFGRCGATLTSGPHKGRACNNLLPCGIHRR